MDETSELPMDWNEWREEWNAWRVSFESRYGVRRGGVPAGTFPGKNFIADEIIWQGMVGQTGDVHPVELSEMTFMGRRGIGVTVDGVGGKGWGEVVHSFDELDTLLGNIVHGRSMP